MTLANKEAVVTAVCLFLLLITAKGDINGEGNVSTSESATPTSALVNSQQQSDSTQHSTLTANSTNEPLAAFETRKISWLEDEGAKQGKDVLTLGYLIPWTKDWEVGPSMGAAILLGLREIERRQLLPDYKIRWVWRDAYCKPRQAMRMAVEMWKNIDHLDVILGDGCSVGCEPVGLLAAVWQMPMISWACNSDLLSNKVTYPTFTRISNTHAMVSPVMDAMMTQFNWTQNIVIVRGVADVFIPMTDALEKELVRSGKIVTTRVLRSTIRGSQLDLESLEEQRKVIRAVRHITRVIFVNMYGTDFRNFLVTCHDYGMLNGDYAFIGYDIGYLLNTPPNFRPELTNDFLTGVLNVAPNLPSGQVWERFAQEVIDAFQHPAFDDVSRLALDADPESVDGYAGMVHDAVLMWGYGVNKTIAQGHDPSNGVKVTENILNLTFIGITGTVAINYQGDRKPNYKVEIFQKDKLITLMEWDPTNEVMIKTYNPNKMHDYSGLIWPGDVAEVPQDSPSCGWQEQFCEKEEDGQLMIIIIGSVVAAVAVFILMAIILVFRKLRYESQLKEATSCVFRWSDVQELNQGVGNSWLTLQSVLTTETTRQHFIHVVRYKDEMAAVKPLGDETVDLANRNILIELKCMKDMSHDNVNAFLGICPEASHACVLMAYASRGSLQDVLLDDSYKLSWDFKLSLAMDLARGMKYLHSAKIGYHGHLTSSNCVVDNRWVCKITDYGLQHMKKQYSGEQGKYDDYHLWTAPELLRRISSRQKYGCADVSFHQKGDVYSFAVVCQEIVLQNVPYGLNEPPVTSEDVVAQVKQGVEPFMRPDLKESCSREWKDLITSSWLENPDSRPTFAKLIGMIRSINGGRDISLVDNMINRLEVHTRQLEEIVAERSKELYEEKHKAEQLLMELLPKSIADKLKLGQIIEPETHQSVTIFFSDVVSFTRISAAGTPIDVVKMLNMMYTLFDDISAAFDVYKVATIGDAYFVASGVPLSNGDRHAGEIGKMALALLEAISNMPIPHLPDETLKLRVGLHSGSCVAGVAGMKMPRYLLFGDTIDIASRMESGGESMRIHVSPVTAELLSKDGGLFVLEQRECSVDVKGLGTVMTYWLTGLQQVQQQLPW